MVNVCDHYIIPTNKDFIAHEFLEQWPDIKTKNKRMSGTAANVCIYVFRADSIGGSDFCASLYKYGATR